jgi:hypothetical protein
MPTSPARAGLFQKVKCQCPRLADFDRDTMAGLEPGTLQPLSGKPDFRLDVPTEKVSATFDLQTACAHCVLPFIWATGLMMLDQFRQQPCQPLIQARGCPTVDCVMLGQIFCADSTRPLKMAERKSPF